MRALLIDLYGDPDSYAVNYPDSSSGGMSGNAPGCDAGHSPEHGPGHSPEHGAEHSTGHSAGHSAGTASRAEVITAHEQTLALARAMHDGGQLAPLLVCRKNSALHTQAVNWGIAVLPISPKKTTGLISLVRLWFAQRKHQTLLIQTVGAEAANLGRRLMALCTKKQIRILSHAFFLRPPSEQSRKDLSAAQLVLCGSEHVKSRITALFAHEEAAKQAKAPAADAINTTDATHDAALGARPDSASDGDSAVSPEAHSGALSDATSGTASGTAPDAKPHKAQHRAPRCLIHAPGIAVQRFALESRRSEQRFVFGLLDCLQPRSGALSILQAMVQLSGMDTLPPWEVRMLGHGPRFNEVLDQARELGVDARLCLLGAQDEAETLRYCSAFIAPGSSPEEAPTTLWAGPAAGLPVICTNSRLHAERLRGHEDIAIIVPENAIEEIARAMIRLMQEPAFGHELSARGARICESISVEHGAARICRLLEDTLRSAKENAESLPHDQHRETHEM